MWGRSSTFILLTLISHTPALLRYECSMRAVKTVVSKNWTDVCNNNLKLITIHSKQFLWSLPNVVICTFICLRDRQYNMWRKRMSTVLGFVNAKIHYMSFPMASWQHPRNKSATSTTSPQQVCNKLARPKVRCVVSQILLQWLVANKFATSPSTGKLRGNVYNGF